MRATPAGSSVVRALSDAEKIAFAEAALRWLELGGSIARGSLRSPPVALEDTAALDDLLDLMERMVFPDGARTIWVEP